MVTCPHYTGCEMFPIFTRNAALRTWQIIYCEGQFERCERLKLARQGLPVPNTMLPNGKTLTTPPRREAGKP